MMMKNRVILTPRIHCPCSRYYQHKVIAGIEFSVAESFEVIAKPLRDIGLLKAGQLYEIRWSGFEIGTDNEAATAIWEQNIAIAPHIRRPRQLNNPALGPTRLDPKRLP